MLRDKPSQISHDAFMAVYGSIYEHSPWIAEKAWQQGDVDTAEALHAAMKQAVEKASYKEQMALIRAHPDLACARGALTDASESEQAGAGLKQCSDAEFAEFQQLNANYREKFGFPFIIAVKGLTRHDILHAFRARLRNETDEEFRTALNQIHKIARLRLEALAEPAPEPSEFSRIMTPKPLTVEAFARFGDVIEASDAAPQKSINYGNTTRFHNLARLDLLAENGFPMVSIFRSKPLQLPIQIKIMERHPLSSQAFYPLSGEPYLVAVAPKGEFDPSKIELFLASANQGVNYHAGTWHHFSLALNKESDFLVIDRGGDGENCDEITLREEIFIELGDGT